MAGERKPAAVAAIDQGAAHLRDRFDAMGVNLADPDQLHAVRITAAFCGRITDRAAYLGLLRCLHEMGEL